VNPEPQSYIAIARIARTRGNRGEVLVDLYTDFPDRFDKLEEVWLESAAGRQTAVIEETWEHKGRRILKFKGIDDIGSAERLVGCWVQVPEDQAVKLPEGMYFDHDLIGCSVENLQGEFVGTVAEILRIAENSQLVVRDRGREHLIPLVRSICVRIEITAKRIVIDPPEGLMDLGK
jgi:16S rRNA processing protein RimM